MENGEQKWGSGKAGENINDNDKMKVICEDEKYMKKYKRNGIVWGKIVLEEVQKQQGYGERVKAEHHYFLFWFYFYWLSVHLFTLFPFNVTLM